MRRHDFEHPRSIPTNRGMILPAYSGVAFLLSWIYLLFYANSAGIEAAAPISLMGIPYTLSTLVMSVAVLVIAFGPAKLSESIMTIRMKIVSALGTSLGTLFMLCADSSNPLWLMLLGSVVTGVFSGILAQQWVIAYRRIGIKTMISSFPTLLAVAVGTCMTIMYLPRLVVLIATIVLPLISGLMLHWVRKSLFPVFDLDASHKDRPLDFVIVVFPISIFAFVSGFLDFFSYQSSYTYFFYMAISAILLVTACVFILIANRDSAFTCLVIPLCFFVCVFVPYFIMFNHMPASNFIAIGELGIEIALFSVAIGFADFFSISPLKTYALCRVTHAVLCAVGWYAGEFSSSYLSDMMNSQASLAVVFIGVEVTAVCLVVAIIKAQKTMGAPSEVVDSDMVVAPASSESLIESETAKDESVEGAPAVTESATSPATTPKTIESKCLTMGREFGLSTREIDVFVLLAQGYSAAAIQGELYIAPGTVNYHTRNIYSKLGVHSKQELIKLVSDF